jgi:CHAT domain-containing protein
VLDRVQLRIAPSARALTIARKAVSNSEEGAVLVAAPEVPGERALRFALPETFEIAAGRPGSDLLVGRDATVARVEELLMARGLAHFACHGRTNFAEPLQSELLLAGGEPLTLGRILQLPLGGLRLAVLSACESGMPEIIVPQEKASLPVGLLLAGAAGVVASLWAVDDRSTMLLMIRLYELLARGADPCAALRSAQLWLRDTPTQDLAAWAGERAKAMNAAGTPQEDATRVASALAGLGRLDRTFAHPFHWAGFAYFGA